MDFDDRDRRCEHQNDRADALGLDDAVVEDDVVEDEVVDDRHPVLVLTEFADRLDTLAATADLMGDDYTAGQWRAKANEVRLRAMSRLDDD